MTTAELNEKEEQQTNEHAAKAKIVKDLLEQADSSDKLIIRHNTKFEFLELVDMSGAEIIKEDTDEARDNNTKILVERSQKEAFFALTNEYIEKVEKLGLVLTIKNISGGPASKKQLMIGGLIDSIFN